MPERPSDRVIQKTNELLSAVGLRAIRPADGGLTINAFDLSLLFRRALKANVLQHYACQTPVARYLPPP